MENPFIKNNPKRRCLIKAYTLLLLLSSIVLISSCLGVKRIRINHQTRDMYVKHFRLYYFKSIIREGFENSKSIHEILLIDNSIGFVEPIFPTEDYLFIDSLAKADYLAIIKDSIARKTSIEGNQGKKVFEFALERYSSKSTKRTAIKHFRKWKRVVNVK